MTIPDPCVVSWEDYDGALFDLDGVITDTAELHASCWKRTFDEFLRRRAISRSEPFRAFDESSDYLTYVDGRPRLDGIRAFLAARDIGLPEGSAADPATADTIHGLGARKNAFVLEAIDAGAVRVYDSSVELVRSLRDAGKAIAIVTSSENGEAILRSVGLLDLFPIRIDGRTISERGLSGKPAPDGFIAGAEALHLPPIRIVIFEDAISGVEAGRNGGFGMIVGVARRNNAEELRASGADVVVSDLAELCTPLPGGRLA